MDSIRINTMSSDDEEQLVQFLVDEFMPDEPICSSLMFNLQGNGLMAKFFRNMFKKDLRPYLASGQSFAAWDEDGNLLGVKVGKVLKSDEELKK